MHLVAPCFHGTPFLIDLTTNTHSDEFTQLNEKFIKARRDYESLLEASMSRPIHPPYPQYGYPIAPTTSTPMPTYPAQSSVPYPPQGAYTIPVTSQTSTAPYPNEAQELGTPAYDVPHGGGGGRPLGALPYQPPQTQTRPPYPTTTGSPVSGYHPYRPGAIDMGNPASFYK